MGTNTIDESIPKNAGNMDHILLITTDFLFNALFGLTYINTPITKLAVVTITKETCNSSAVV